MAFALTSVQAYGIEAEEPVNKRYTQRIILAITAANTDTDLDIGDFSGTFWTAVGSSSAQAVDAQLALKATQLSADSLILVQSTSLWPYARVSSGSPSANEYHVALDSTNTQLPNIALHSGDAPTSYKLVLDWVLKPQSEPVEVNS